MKWMRERDLLIAQTLAFVQSVTGKLPETDKAAATTAVEPIPAVEPIVETTEEDRAVSAPVEVIAPPVEIEPLPVDDAPVLPPLVEWPVSAAPEEPAPPIVIPAQPEPDIRVRVDLREDFQSEIRARVASFRAHQERFTREREAYCSTTMAKVHASIRDVGQTTRTGE